MRTETETEERGTEAEGKEHTRRWLGEEWRGVRPYQILVMGGKEVEQPGKGTKRERQKWKERECVDPVRHLSPLVRVLPGHSGSP